MNYKSATKLTPDEGRVEHPFDAAKESVNLFGHLRRSNSFLKIVIYILLGIVGVQFFGWMHAESLPRQIPYIIEVTPWGEARYVGNIGKAFEGSIPISDVSKQFYMRYVIERIRSIPLDPNVMVKNLDEAFELLGERAAKIITDDIQKENMYGLQGRTRREVTVESLINVTGDVWQIDWVEKDFLAESTTISVLRHERAIVTLGRGPTSQTPTGSNPLGLYFDTYHRSEIQEGSK